MTSENIDGQSPQLEWEHTESYRRHVRGLLLQDMNRIRPLDEIDMPIKFRSVKTIGEGWKMFTERQGAVTDQVRIVAEFLLQDVTRSYKKEMGQRFTAAKRILEKPHHSEAFEKVFRDAANDLRVPNLKNINDEAEKPYFDGKTRLRSEYQHLAQDITREELARIQEQRRELRILEKMQRALLEEQDREGLTNVQKQSVEEWIAKVGNKIAAYRDEGVPEFRTDEGAFLVLRKERWRIERQNDGLEKIIERIPGGSIRRLFESKEIADKYKDTITQLRYGNGRFQNVTGPIRQLLYEMQVAISGEHRSGRWMGRSRLYECVIGTNIDKILVEGVSLGEGHLHPYRVLDSKYTVVEDGDPRFLYHPKGPQMDRLIVKDGLPLIHQETTIVRVMGDGLSEPVSLKSFQESRQNPASAKMW